MFTLIEGKRRVNPYTLIRQSIPWILVTLALALYIVAGIYGYSVGWGGTAPLTVVATVIFTFGTGIIVAATVFALFDFVRFTLDAASKWLDEREENFGKIED